MVVEVGFRSLDLFVMMSLSRLYYCVESVRLVTGVCGLMKRVSLDWMWLRQYLSA